MPHFNIAREPANKEGTFFYHIEDGFHYHKSSEKDGTLYFKCVQFERGCRGRAIFNLFDGFYHSQPHDTHPADIHYPDEQALRHSVLNRCKQLEYVGYKDILAQESRR